MIEFKPMPLQLTKQANKVLQTQAIVLRRRRKAHESVLLIDYLYSFPIYHNEQYHNAQHTEEA